MKPKEAVYTFMSDHLWSITTGKLCEVVSVVTFAFD